MKSRKRIHKEIEFKILPSRIPFSPLPPVSAHRIKDNLPMHLHMQKSKIIMAQK